MRVHLDTLLTVMASRQSALSPLLNHRITTTSHTDIRLTERNTLTTTVRFVSAQTVDADQLHVGQQISVIYNSKDPQQPCSCDVNELASSAWVNELIPVLVLIPVILVMVIVLLMRHRRQRSQRADGAT